MNRSIVLPLAVMSTVTIVGLGQLLYGLYGLQLIIESPTEIRGMPSNLPEFLLYLLFLMAGGLVFLRMYLLTFIPYLFVFDWVANRVTPPPGVDGQEFYGFIGIQTLLSFWFITGGIFTLSFLVMMIPLFREELRKPK